MVSTTFLVGTIMLAATSVSAAQLKGSSQYSCRNYYSIDFVGNDIASKPGAQLECCTICDQTPGCKAYSFADGICYLKSGVGDAISKEGVISGTSGLNIGAVCPFEFDVDFVGSDIGNQPAKDAGACCSQCKSNSECKAYTWSNYNGGTCWMKRNRGKMTPTPGVVSAVVVAGDGGQ
jgi:cellobiose dehydrogenase (acceptor)